MTLLKEAASEHFSPQKISTSPFKLLLGSMFMDDVSTKDHKGKIKTTTFGSIAKYLTEYDLVSEAVVLNKFGKPEPLT